jgi:HEPN domain-containing protein
MNSLQYLLENDQPRSLSRNLRRMLFDYIENEYRFGLPAFFGDLFPAINSLFNFLDDAEDGKINAALLKDQVFDAANKSFPPWLLENKTLFGAVRFIVETIHPVRIYCINHGPAINEGGNWMDLVIIVSNEHNAKPFNEYENIIEAGCINNARLSFSLHQACHVKSAMEEGYIFYSLVCIPENLVYDDGTLQWEQAPPEKKQAAVEKAAFIFQCGFNRAVAFLQTADTFSQKEEYPLAAFFLQQAAELCLRSLTCALLGYEKRTHAITALKKYCSRCAPQVNEIFPDDTDEEKRLTKLLEDAYLGGRYEENFTVKPNDLELLMTKVRRLHQCSLDLVKHKLDSSFQ